jgi:hypothetical protein
VTPTAHGRRRLLVLLGSVGALALGMTLPGLIEQGRTVLRPPTPEPTLSPAYRETREETRLLLLRLRELGQKHHWDHVLAQVDRVCGDTCTLGLRAMRAEALTRLGRNTEAAAVWRGVRTDLGPSYEAPILLLEGRIVEYDALCQQMLSRLDPIHPDRIGTRTAVWTALLSPTPREPKRLLELARYTDSVPQSAGSFRPPDSSLISAALLRFGKPDEALRGLEEGSSLPRVRALRALALRQQGRLGEALHEARLYRQYLDTTFGIPTRERVELLVLLRELDNPPGNFRSP